MKTCGDMEAEAKEIAASIRGEIAQLEREGDAGNRIPTLRFYLAKIDKLIVSIGLQALREADILSLDNDKIGGIEP